LAQAAVAASLSAVVLLSARVSASVSYSARHLQAR
jgi:hypothetical protein